MKISDELYKDNLPSEAQPEISLIELPLGNTLIVDQKSGNIKLINCNQVLQLIIGIREEGLIVNLNASQLSINATDELNLMSKKINIHATEQINIQTGGNLVTEVGKDCLSEIAGTNKSMAQIHKISANLGNVDIKANDDIRLDGERVLLNCD